MPVIAIFSGTYCNENAVVQDLCKRTGYDLVTDTQLIGEASRASGIPEPKIERAFSARLSVFNKFTHERERSIAHLRFVLAQHLVGDNRVVEGSVSQLIPTDISHVLRVCLIADMKTRVAAAADHLKVSQHDAVKLIHKQEADCAAWTQTVRGQSDPWDAGLYDMVLPTDKLTVEAMVDSIVDAAQAAVVRSTQRSQQLARDFLLAAQVQVDLAQEGHSVMVEANGATVTLTINEHVLMLSRLENELKSIASRIDGVKEVITQVGPGFYQADIYRKQDFSMPSKILLVDDEREFVQTLSERLLMRDMGSAVAYDGESALEVVREDEPDVMILDLKMPGIDGIEVLRRVKATQPEIEVIILTGHGSEADRITCMQLGAFAYLQKPVDVEELSKTIKQANEKIQLKRQAQA